MMFMFMLSSLPLRGGGGGRHWRHCWSWYYRSKTFYHPFPYPGLLRAKSSHFGSGAGILRLFWGWCQFEGFLYSCWRCLVIDVCSFDRTTALKRRSWFYESESNKIWTVEKWLSTLALLSLGLLMNGYRHRPLQATRCFQDPRRSEVDLNNLAFTIGYIRRHTELDMWRLSPRCPLEEMIKSLNEILRLSNINSKTILNDTSLGTSLRGLERTKRRVREPYI